MKERLANYYSLTAIKVAQTAYITLTRIIHSLSIPKPNYLL
ncbi:hypothetical protein MNBD_BACTEROID03-2638 [hydrothermal vent metagenome]|uniref:Uncharacterized protein n=1 Tax=hydrothermal vent metagenome TaxID=652676 RepID=A0A3B0T749_9ZZZZ